VWILLTSLKGPNDAIFSVPPQFIPGDPTLANYARVWDQLPVPAFFLNSIVVTVAITVLNTLIAALAAYPLAKMRFRGREPLFYLLLGTLIVPVQLTYIPSYVLAVRVFDYHDTLLAVILPNLVSAFNVFLLRQAFRGVPNDLLDAARIDGAGEWRIWRSLMLPLVRPSLAAVAIFTFVTAWNDFLWPSLMLPTMDNKTLPVGLAALQGFFSSDFRAIAAGVTMTVVPILIFFVAVQRFFVRGLAGAVKG
jgi:putative chitobiose transport system permease protein